MVQHEGQHMQTSYTQYWDLGLQAGKVLLGLNKSSITYVVRKENTFFFILKEISRRFILIRLQSLFLSKLKGVKGVFKKHFYII